MIFTLKGVLLLAGLAALLSTSCNNRSDIGIREIETIVFSPKNTDNNLARDLAVKSLKGRRVSIRGQLLQFPGNPLVQTDDEGDLYIIIGLGGSGGASHFTWACCFFSKSHAKTLAALAKGDSLSIRGSFYGIERPLLLGLAPMNSMTLTDCASVK
jgi:hypothetical protein